MIERDKIISITGIFLAVGALWYFRDTPTIQQAMHAINIASDSAKKQWEEEPKEKPVARKTHIKPVASLKKCVLGNDTLYTSDDCPASYVTESIKESIPALPQAANPHHKKVSH